MNNKYNKVTDANLDLSCQYIETQFAVRSWWPKAQPAIAEREFELMRGSAIALNIWCERWLDLGQVRKLGKAVK